MSDYLDEEDEMWKLWNEKHPQFRDYIENINQYAQGDDLDEEDVDYFQSYFENGDYNELFEELKVWKNKIQNLYFAIDNAYDYIEKLNKTQKLVTYTFEAINGDDDVFDLTISKDGEVLYTIHCNLMNKTVSEFPHFYHFNKYNKQNFWRGIWRIHVKKDFRTFLKFYEEV